MSTPSRSMRGVRPESSFGNEPRLADLPAPRPGPGEVLLRVRASALNRADLLQLRGLYPPPAGESEIPGLECAGEILATGSEAETTWRVGDRVMALLAGGGHAEQVVAPVGQLMPIPEGLDFRRAAALPEAALTAWTNLVEEGGLARGQTVLVTAAASGIGTFAVQLARELGARVMVAGRDLERLERLRPLGAEATLPLVDSLPQRLREANGGRGADLILDLVGGPSLSERLGALRTRGRLVLVGLLAGARAELDLRQLMGRRLHLVGSVLRSRSRTEKAALIEAFWEFARERLADGRLEPVVHGAYPLEHIAEAYRKMEEGGVWGKLVVEMDA